jgi:miniconductance mechanosensitive channel
MDEGKELAGFLGYLLFLTGAVVASFLLVRYALIPLLYRAMERTRTEWDDTLIQRGVFRRFSYLAPAIVLYFGVGNYPEIAEIARQLILAYIVLEVVIIHDRLLTAGLDIYGHFPVAKKRPIKAYVQLAKLIVYILGGATVIALLLGKSPWGLLGGLGAMMAVLILVFRNTILSLIASIQLVANDLLHMNDWIEVSEYGADGEVIDIALHTVKVRNWDKTIVTVPTYKLMEESFKNWRGMRETGGRRIKRSLLIDQTSVRFCDERMLQKFADIDRLKPYIEAKTQELEQSNAALDPERGKVQVNRRVLTNLGTFRAYALAYINEISKISNNLTIMVRHLQPTPDGLPLEIYAFSTETGLETYEGVQADIFDHLLAVMPYFELRVFQHPTGENMKALKEWLRSETVT